MVRAEHLQQLWKEKYDEWLKRPKSKFSLEEIIPIVNKPPGDTGAGEKAHKRQGLFGFHFMQDGKWFPVSETL